MGPGARGPQVLALEQKLDALRFDVGKVDDTYDAVTAYAVTAFQKVHGFGRTGRATDEIVAAVNRTNSPPPALVPGGGSTRIEVDVPRQVLFLYEGNSLFRILPVSTGSRNRFCSEGYCRVANTPGGSYATYRKAKGWEKSPLGQLYNPIYFNGGIAIHGAPSVPAYPASHGCVRIPMNAAEWFFGKVGLGVPVYVIGAKGENPAPLPVTTAPPVTTTPTVPPVVTLPPTSTTIPTTTTLTTFPFTIPTEPL